MVHTKQNKGFSYLVEFIARLLHVHCRSSALTYMGYFRVVNISLMIGLWLTRESLGCLYSLSNRENEDKNKV